MLSPETQYSNTIPFRKLDDSTSTYVWYHYKQKLSWTRDETNGTNIKVTITFIKRQNDPTGNCPYKSIKILYRVKNEDWEDWGNWVTQPIISDDGSTHYAPDGKTFGDETTPITIPNVSLDSDFEIKSITEASNNKYFIAPIPCVIYTNGEYKHAEPYIYRNITSAGEKWNPAMPYVYIDGGWHNYTPFINNNT